MKFVYYILYTCAIIFIFITLTPKIATAHEEVDVRLAIAACESGGLIYGQIDYTAVNYDWPNSTATGGYQFLRSTVTSTIDNYAPQYSQYRNFLAKDIPPEIQDALFWALYNNVGLSPWKASEHCWAKWVYRNQPVPAITPLTDPSSTTTPVDYYLDWFDPSAVAELPAPEYSRPYATKTETQEEQIERGNRIITQSPYELYYLDWFDSPPYVEIILGPIPEECFYSFYVDYALAVCYDNSWFDF